MGNLSDIVGVVAGMQNPMTTDGDLIIGGGDGNPARLAIGTDGQMLMLASGVPVWGGGYIDWANPISVTTTTTLTIGKHHVCSGTSADYTVTLPAASGNAGKLLSVEMSGALTKLVTLDGNSSETIDGATTRVMWARETAILLCDDVQWTKVAGKSRPTIAGLKQGADQLFNNAEVKINIDTQYLAPSVASMHNTTDKRIIIPRPSVYAIYGKIQWSNTNTVADRHDILFYKNGSLYAGFNQYLTASTFWKSQYTTTAALSAGDYLELYAYNQSTNYTTTASRPNDSETYMTIQEFCQW